MHTKSIKISFTARAGDKLRLKQKATKLIKISFLARAKRSELCQREE